MNMFELFVEAREFVKTHVEAARRDLELPILVNDLDEIKNLKMECLLELEVVAQKRMFWIENCMFDAVKRKNDVLKEGLEKLQADFHESKDGAKIRSGLAKLQTVEMEKINAEIEDRAKGCLQKTRYLLSDDLYLITEKYKAQKELILRNRVATRDCPLD